MSKKTIPIDRLVEDGNGEPRRRHSVSYVKSKTIPLASVGIPEQVLFRSATQSGDEAVIVSDVQGNIIFWDEGAKRLFGYVEEEVLGRPLSLLMCAKHSSRSTRFDDMLYTQTFSSDGKTRELKGIRKDKREFPVEMSLLTWKFGEKPFFTTIMRDITERKRLQKEIIEISGREQKRIGQDLHDGICQDLTSITILTTVLQKKLLEKSLRDAGDLEEITNQITEVIVKAKLLAKGLLPVEWEAQGLMTALRELAGVTQRLSKVSCRMRSTKLVRVSDNTVAVQLYRIAQEGVNNALKHAKCKHIDISLTRRGREIVLSIKDDGIGIKKSDRNKGLGLSIMYSRAETINATLQINRGRHGGTDLVCSLLPPPPPTSSKGSSL